MDTRKLTDYHSPCIDDLARLKGELGFTGEQMATLAGVTASNQWRKYTGGASPRALSQHMLFYIAARMVLAPAQLDLVLVEMRRLGARFEVVP